MAGEHQATPHLRPETRDLTRCNCSTVIYRGDHPGPDEVDPEKDIGIYKPMKYVESAVESRAYGVLEMCVTNDLTAG